MFLPFVFDSFACPCKKFAVFLECRARNKTEERAEVTWLLGARGGGSCGAIVCERDLWGDSVGKIGFLKVSGDGSVTETFCTLLREI